MQQRNNREDVFLAFINTKRRKNMKKTVRSFCLLLAALMILTTVIVTVSAEPEAAPADNGIIGYSDSLVEKVDLADIADLTTYDAANVAAAYKIKDVAGYLKLVEIVNAETAGGKVLKGVTIYLENDIDISEVEGQSPIG